MTSVTVVGAFFILFPSPLGQGRAKILSKLRQATSLPGTLRRLTGSACGAALGNEVTDRPLSRGLFFSPLR
jgi:hypothetical protein